MTAIEFSFATFGYSDAAFEFPNTAFEYSFIALVCSKVTSECSWATIVFPNNYLELRKLELMFVGTALIFGMPAVLSSVSCPVVPIFLSESRPAAGGRFARIKQISLICLSTMCEQKLSEGSEA
jgi:hypothetical protein